MDAVRQLTRQCRSHLGTNTIGGHNDTEYWTLFGKAFSQDICESKISEIDAQNQDTNKNVHVLAANAGVISVCQLILRHLIEDGKRIVQQEMDDDSIDVFCCMKCPCKDNDRCMFLRLSGHFLAITEVTKVLSSFMAIIHPHLDKMVETFIDISKRSRNALGFQTAGDKKVKMLCRDAFWKARYEMMPFQHEPIKVDLYNASIIRIDIDIREENSIILHAYDTKPGSCLPGKEENAKIFRNELDTSKEDRKLRIELAKFLQSVRMNYSSEFILVPMTNAAIARIK